LSIIIKDRIARIAEGKKTLALRMTILVFSLKQMETNPKIIRKMQQMPENKINPFNRTNPF
jgi:hypothetical protein